jgi:hypothetical protein
MRFLTICAALAAVPALGLAQETTGIVQGRLRSQAGEPVVSARITATSPDLLGTRHAESAKDGVFTLIALPPGTYTLRIAAIGYRPLAFQKVQVQLGRVTGLGEVKLDQSPVTLEEVVITASRITLDPVGTTVGGTLDARDYAALPTDRDYKSLITILPHINTSYLGDPANSAGSTGLENMYFIDGVNVTEPLRASGGTSLPYNFIKTVEVRSGGYEAEYGRALGAIVNAITYTGSNQFEANVFGFMTHSALSSTPREQLALRETGAYSYDIGARVSGPVRRDRLWFSTAYNPRIAHADRQIGELGTFADRSRSDVFAGKLTWKPAAAADVELSIFGDPSVRHEVAACFWCRSFRPLNPEPYLHRLETGGTSVSLRTVATPRPWLTLEGALSHSSGRENIEAETETGRTEPQVLDFVEQTVSGGFDLVTISKLKTEAATIKGTFTAGTHRVGIGGELLATTVSRASTIGGRIGRIERANGYSTRLDAFDGHFRNLAPAVYVQDAWRVGKGWTLNAGVRWSQQRLVGTSGGVAQRLAPEWQPRTGFSWQLGANASNRIFGSYGRFYQFEPLNLPSLYYVDYTYREWYWNQDPRLSNSIPHDSVDYSTPEAAFTNVPGKVTPERFDEFTVGYEHLFGSAAKLTARGIRRHLGTTFQQGADPASATFFVLGTPGKGDLSFLPPARRDYTALEVGLDGNWRRLSYRMSYVLSRTWGNFPGLFSSDFYVGSPGSDYGLTTADQDTNSTGYLPNDHRHVVKIAGALRLPVGFEAGTILVWESGAPLNEFGVGRILSSVPTFLSPRGSVGRAPAIYDLSLRVGYTPPSMRRSQARVLLDMVHVGNPRRAVRVDQQHYFGVDRTLPNANYLRATAFQPPMAARLGLEINF